MGVDSTFQSRHEKKLHSVGRSLPAFRDDRFRYAIEPPKHRPDISGQYRQW
jgi:hypothetical protein